MLPKPNRLSSSQITEVLQKGRRAFLPEFQLVYQKKATSPSRFAVIVSTKIDKRAVARNRMKRLVGESLQHLLLNLKTNLDGVILARKNFSDLTQVEVAEKLRGLLEKIYDNKQ